MSKWWRTTAMLISVFLGMLAVTPPGSAGTGYSEDAVKAAFLARFAEYVEWPPDAPAAAHFTIAVLGAEEVAVNLQRLLPGYAIKNLPAQVRKIHSVQELGDSRIMFVGADHSDALHAVAAKIAERPVLLVTDQEKSIDAGGIVNFVLIDNRVRFEVSMPAAERSRLRISSELLSVAFRVQLGHQGSTAGCERRKPAAANIPASAQSDHLPDGGRDTPASGGPLLSCSPSDTQRPAGPGLVGEISR